ncbi:MAG TPA: thioredoxin domain-containing protein, partial [bacterium]|nr:thioredoxin domain-containing protein [bacterium]
MAAYGFSNIRRVFFYGGTYFPKDANYGIPSYKSVLTEISKYYRENREAIFAQSLDFYNRIFEESGKFSIFNINIKRINDAIKKDNSINVDYVKKLLNEGALEFKLHFDGDNGGIDESPKFFHFSALELLSWDYIINKNRDSLSKGVFTLKKIASGGVFDHVGGGFHRYSTDKKWIIPHFEKLTEVNANA